MNVQRWRIAPAASDGPSFVIAASTAAIAWAKFITQRFGALKPARSDWTISKVTL